MLKIILPFCTLLLINCSSQKTLQSWQDQKSQELLRNPQFNEATQKGLKSYISLIPPEELSHYGFKSSDELNRLSLGSPVALLLLNGDLPDTTRPIWTVPILCDSSARALLSLEKNNDTWKVVSLGSAGIAARRDEMINTLPEFKNSQTHSYPPIVRSINLKTDYLIVNDKAYPLFPVNNPAISLQELKIQNQNTQLQNIESPSK
jgi:hypothetical protein